MSYLNWKVGDQVVCVDASKRDDDEVPGWIMVYSGDWPEEGSIYTISGFGFDEIDDEPVVYLEELRPPVSDDEAFMGKTINGFLPDRFRKVQPRKTDIAIFEAILHGARVPEDA